MKSNLRQMLEQFGSRSIYVRLTLYAIVIIVLSSGVRLAYVTIVLNHDVADLAANSQLATATYIAKDIDSSVRQRFDFLRVAAAQFPAGADRDPGLAQRWIDGNLFHRLLFPDGLALYDTRGVLIAASSRAAGAAGATAAADDHAWLGRALDAPDPLIARLYKAGDEQRPLAMMTQAIRDEDGRAVAVIAGTTALLEESFLKPVYEQRIGERGGVLVIEPQSNLIVTSSSRPMALAPAAPPRSNPLHDRARAGYRGVGETVSADGQKVLSAVVSIPAPGWFLVVHQPLDQAYQPILHMRSHLFLISAIYIVMAVLFVYYSVNYLLRPLIDAALRLQAMARGDAPVDFLPQQRDDEIGLIATGFNSLLIKLREKEAEVSHMAHHDALTGLPNLQLFRDRLTQALLYAQRHDGGLALLYLDLDGFKPVNDRLGHAAGDMVLREVACRISGILRKSDTVARIGGDEFAVILADTGDSAELVAEKCRQAIRQPIHFEDHDIRIGVSIGSAFFPIDGTTEEELVRKADTAMYCAKRAAKDDAGGACK